MILLNSLHKIKKWNLINIKSNIVRKVVFRQENRDGSLPLVERSINPFPKAMQHLHTLTYLHSWIFTAVVQDQCPMEANTSHLVACLTSYKH